MHFVVPGASGSSADRVARLVAGRLTGLWNSPTLVEDKPGATGIIAAEFVKRAAPDGATALFAITALVQLPSIYRTLPYDFRKDFAPVTSMVIGPSLLAVRADSPYHTLAEYAAAAKAKPNTISYGSFGVGSAFHIYGETFSHDAGIELVHVPFESEVRALTDLLGGHINSSFLSLMFSAEQIKAGELRPLAVNGQERSSLLPEVRTFVELGYPRLDVRGWYGVLLPAATPRPIVDKLSADINAVLRQPDMVEILRGWGGEPVGMTPQKFASFLDSEYEKWRALIQEIGIPQQ